MNRKRLRKLQASFAKRRGVFFSSPDTPPEVSEMFLQQLLECPDCRPAVLEACAGEDPRNVDIGVVMRKLATRRDH